MSINLASIIIICLFLQGCFAPNEETESESNSNQTSESTQEDPTQDTPGTGQDEEEFSGPELIEDENENTEEDFNDNDIDNFSEAEENESNQDIDSGNANNENEDEAEPPIESDEGPTDSESEATNESTTEDENVDEDEEEEEEEPETLTYAPNDPLFKYQWYLKNNGEILFNHGELTEGKDINLKNTHLSYDGSGETIVISDSGIDLFHPDLENTDLANSKNYTDATTDDPTPTNNTDNHGTFVMGIAGATADNSEGIVGVAPEANLIGYKFLGEVNANTISNFFDQMSAPVPSTFNYSYGYPNCEVIHSHRYFSDYDYSLILKNNTYTNKHSYVTAAGNDQFGALANCDTTANSNDLFVGNSNYNQDKAWPEMIVVGATNSLGRPTRYTTHGSNILVAAPGGDFNSFFVGLDQTNCSDGLSVDSFFHEIDWINDFDSGTSSENSNCNYVYLGMQGTSYSSPVVTGTIALIKQACPTCDFRQIKDLLITNARQIDNFNPRGHFLDEGKSLAELAAHSYELSGHIWEKGNITNNAGYTFNNYTGFGIIDVDETIKQAEIFQKDMGNYKQTKSIGSAPYYKSEEAINIPDNGSVGITKTINVNDHYFTIEGLVLEIRLNHPAPNEVGIEITSPSGTLSTITYVNTEVTENGIDGNKVFYLTNAFYGEKTNGDWLVKFIDGKAGSTGSADYIGLHFTGGTWNNSVSETPVTPVNNLTRTSDDLFTFEHSDTSNISRFEYCITQSEHGCPNNAWLSISNSQFTINDNQFLQITWQDITSSNNYTIHIKAIDHTEAESETITFSWSE